jgi:hypothetical protein
MQVTGYITRVTDAANQFVFAKDAATVGVKPLWIPVRKIVSAIELDAKSVNIVTAQDGERVGIPFTLDIDDAFAAKVGLA